MTVLYGLLGHPVAHSLSPLMMNTAFSHMGIDATYVAFDVHPDELGSAIQGLAAIGCGGVNVTIPHKQTVLRYVTELTPEATYAGAVNTIAFEAATGAIRGHNTDAAGWWSSIEPVIGPLHKRVLILGAGGAARAAVAAIAANRPQMEVFIAARTYMHSFDLARDFDGRCAVQAIDWSARHEQAAVCDVIVNATSIGMWPHVHESPIEDERCLTDAKIVSDMVYHPETTMLLEQARRRGATVIRGLEMLARQGAAGFEFWHKQQAPLERMLEVITLHLSKNPR